MPSRLTRLRELPRDRPLLALAVAIVGVELLGGSGSLFTAQGLTGWYYTLQQPALSPPGWVFGVVWPVLFALIGTALWLVWRRIDTAPRRVRTALVVFVIHFGFNIGWSVVFFGLREIGWGLAVIGGLWLLILALIWAFGRVDRRAGVLLVPYFVWVTFAAYLNYQFWVLN